MASRGKRFCVRKRFYVRTQKQIHMLHMLHMLHILHTGVFLSSFISRRTRSPKVGSAVGDLMVGRERLV